MGNRLNSDLVGGAFHTSGSMSSWRVKLAADAERLKMNTKQWNHACVGCDHSSRAALVDAIVQQHPQTNPICEPILLLNRRTPSYNTKEAWYMVDLLLECTSSQFAASSRSRCSLLDRIS